MTIQLRKIKFVGVFAAFVAGTIYTLSCERLGSTSDASDSGLTKTVLLAECTTGADPSVNTVINNPIFSKDNIVQILDDQQNYVKSNFGLEEGSLTVFNCNDGTHLRIVVIH